MNLCRWLLRNQKWPILAWYDFDRLRCQNYYAHWREFLLQQQYEMLPLAEIPKRWESLIRTLGDAGRIFIRPDDNAKSFAGGVVHEVGFDVWWKRANFYGPSPDALAVVARPQAIRSDWRLIIANRRVVAGSTYRVDGIESISPAFPSEVVRFAETVASVDFEPHPVYVMDVCDTENGYRVVEIGSICCASLYACDLERVVTAVSEVAQNMAVLKQMITSEISPLGMKTA